MKKLTVTICLSVALLLGGVSTSFALPPCPSSQDKNYHNCSGTITSKDGLKYVGEWKNGKYHGQGTLTFGPKSKWAGHKYVGEWKNDKYHGSGTYTYGNDGHKYVGEWKNGKFHGQGTLTFDDGLKYVGEWKNDNRHGQGTLTFADGTKKEGVWKDGKFQYARSAAQHRRELKLQREKRYQERLTKCRFDNVEKITNAYTRKIVEEECRRRVKK